MKHFAKPHTDWHRGPSGKWTATVWFWCARLEDGTIQQFSTEVTNLTPLWCRKHKWATDFVCCSGLPLGQLELSFERKSA